MFHIKLIDKHIHLLGWSIATNCFALGTHTSYITGITPDWPLLQGSIQTNSSMKMQAPRGAKPRGAFVFNPQLLCRFFV